MDVITREEGGKLLAIVRLRGDLDIERSNKLLEVLISLEDRQLVNILVDLEKVKFICSAALGILISTLQDLIKLDGSLKLLNVQGGVEEKFKITQLLDKFETYGSEEEALRSFRRGKDA